MFALGVDPGLTRCGYAVMKRDRLGIELVDAGLIETASSDPVSHRLLEVYRELVILMGEYRIDRMVVERVLFQTNVKTAMSVAQASGAALMAAASCGVGVVQMSTNEMKLSLVGDGSASKMQLQTMVQRLLHLERLPNPPDVVDAIGLAYSYLSASISARELWSLT